MDEAMQSVPSPLGTLLLTASGSGLTGCRLLQAGEAFAQKPNAVTQLAAKELARYFTGDSSAFTVPLQPRGTGFQLAVWHTLQQLPFGRTCTYASLAKSSGYPRACRAVGSAVGKNPLLIFIPCHRVLASGGKIGGFSAGGIENKRILLRMENVL